MLSCIGFCSYAKVSCDTLQHLHGKVGSTVTFVSIGVFSCGSKHGDLRRGLFVGKDEMALPDDIICWDGIQKGMSDLVDSWLHLPSGKPVRQLGR